MLFFVFKLPQQSKNLCFEKVGSVLFSQPVSPKLRTYEFTEQDKPYDAVVCDLSTLVWNCSFNVVLCSIVTTPFGEGWAILHVPSKTQYTFRFHLM